MSLEDEVAKPVAVILLVLFTAGMFYGMIRQNMKATSESSMQFKFTNES